jgi:ABC-type lipoprotein release transport system permease subunit
MILSLAARDLLRHRTRSLLLGLGIAVATAILLDMMLLSGGILASFRSLLSGLGFEVRVTPRGTLPFSGESYIEDGDALRGRLAADPDVREAAAFFGSTVYVAAVSANARAAVPAFALGVDAAGRRVYSVIRGRDLGLAAPSGDAAGAAGRLAPGGIVLNERLAAILGVAPGDAVRVAAEAPSVGWAGSNSVLLRVAAVARFTFDSARQSTAAMALDEQRALEGLAGAGSLSMIALALRDRSRADEVVARLRASEPTLEAYSLEDLVRRLEESRSYFKQFSRVLGSVSILVNLLLVGILFSISVREQWPQLAVLRTIGFPRHRLVSILVVQGLLLSLAAGSAGLALGHAVARILDRILKESPGLSSDVSFFVPRPGIALACLGLVCAIGVLGSLVASLPIARMRVAAVLREEAP